MLGDIARYVNVLDQPLWHRQALAIAAQSTVQFFNASGPDKQVTNLTQPNQLPGSNTFRCVGIRLYVDPQNQANAAPIVRADINGVLRAHVDLRLDDVSQFEGLAWMVPGGAGAGGFFVDGAAEDNFLYNGNTDTRNIRWLKRPVDIPPKSSFALFLNWPNAAFTPTVTMFITAALEGVYLRKPR